MSGIVVHSTPVREVQFVCPQCGVDRDGTVVDLQRWFAVIGLRLVPLANLDPMVECHACAHRCGVAVLSVPTAAVLAEMLRTALRHAVATLVRLSTSDPVARDEVERGAVALMRNAGYAYDRFELEDDMDALRDVGTGPHMLQLADELTPHGKQSLLHRLNVIATIDGPARPAQREALIRIGTALGMALPHIHGVLAVHRSTESASEHRSS